MKSFKVSSCSNALVVVFLVIVAVTRSLNIEDDQWTDVFDCKLGGLCVDSTVECVDENRRCFVDCTGKGACSESTVIDGRILTGTNDLLVHCDGDDACSYDMTIYCPNALCLVACKGSKDEDVCEGITVYAQSDTQFECDSIGSSENCKAITVIAVDPEDNEWTDYFNCKEDLVSCESVECVDTNRKCLVDCGGRNSCSEGTVIDGRKTSSRGLHVRCDGDYACSWDMIIYCPNARCSIACGGDGVCEDITVYTQRDTQFECTCDSPETCHNCDAITIISID